MYAMKSFIVKRVYRYIIAIHLTMTFYGVGLIIILDLCILISDFIFSSAEIILESLIGTCINSLGFQPLFLIFRVRAFGLESHAMLIIK